METEKTDAGRQSTPARNRRWRRAVVATSVLGGMLFSGIAILPIAVLNSSHRDALLNSRFEKHGLTVASESAVGSWVTPISLRNIAIIDESGQIQCTIREVQTSRTILGLLAHGGDLGTITFVEPVLHVTLDENGRLPPRLLTPDESDEDPAEAADAAGSRPSVAFEVAGGAFVLSVPWRPMPIVEVDGLNVSAAVTNRPDGRWLTVSPVQIFDHERLSESHTEQNLALIAPVLSQSTSLTGEVSVFLNGLEVLLDGDEDPVIPISGAATFHTVEARLKKDWATQLSQLAGRTVGARIPDRLQIVRDSQVAFEVDEIGIHHHGLAFLLPEIAPDLSIESSGTVGLDERLNLALSVQLPQLLPQNPLMAALSRFARFPLRLQVQGTVDDPKLVTPPGFSLVDQLAQNADPEGFTPEPPPVSTSVLELIDAAASSNPDRAADGIVGGIFNIIRSAQKAKADAPPQEPRPKKIKKKRRRSL